MGMKVPRVSGSNVKRRRESCVHPSPGDRHALTNYPYVAARLARTVYAYIFYKFLSSLLLRRAPAFNLSYNKGNITVSSPLREKPFHRRPMGSVGHSPNRSPSIPRESEERDASLREMSASLFSNSSATRAFMYNM